MLLRLVKIRSAPPGKPLCQFNHFIPGVFVGVSSNITDLYNKAKTQGAYHYMAAADVFHALGYMEMLDLYGEMPYTQGGPEIPSPCQMTAKLF